MWDYQKLNESSAICMQPKYRSGVLVVETNCHPQIYMYSTCRSTGTQILQTPALGLNVHVVTSIITIPLIQRLTTKVTD